MYFSGLLLLSAQFVRIATNDMLVITNGTVFVSVHRVQIATGTTPGSGCTSCFVSAHRLQIATWSSRPITDGTTTLSQRTACRSQRQMCIKHRVRICGMRCKSVDSFSQHEDLLRADYFPELFCYQSSLRCH